MSIKRFIVAAIVGALAATLHVGCTAKTPSTDSHLQSDAPLGKYDPTLTTAQLDTLLRKNFRLVGNIADLPDVVKSSLCNLEHCNFKGVKFDMVNPGEPMSTDYIMAGVPNKRLRFAALNQHAAIVSYELGGYANQFCVIAFDFQMRASWGATINSRVNTLDELRKAIIEKHFVQWPHGGRT